MKTHDQEPDQNVQVEDVREGRAESVIPASSPFPHRRGVSRHVTWISSLVVIALIGVSASVFALLYHQQTQSQANGNFWNQALSNYQVSSLVAAPGQPARLYACAMSTKAHPTTGGVTQAPASQVYTLLRSDDAGSHWQDVGKQAGLGSSCEVVVSSTNANELYVLSSASISLPGSTLPFLKHSLDGGRSWQAVAPKLHGANSSWSVSQISLVDNQLFGVQAMPQGTVPRGASGQPALQFGLLRLVKSVDGGQTWSAVDTQLAGQGLSVHQYKVGPSNGHTLYVLAGGSGFPGIITPQTPQASGLVGTELYKSTDGGTSWTSIRKNLSYSAQLQLASARPGLLYLSQTFGPVPLASNSAPDNHALPAVGKALSGGQHPFSLQMSSDGGKSWKDITPANTEALSSSWVVGSDGVVYRYARSFQLPALQGGSGSSGSSSGNPVQGTVGVPPGGKPVAGTPLAHPTTLPQLKNGVPYIPANGTPAAPVITSPPSPQSTDTTVQQAPPPGVGSLQAYDPAVGGWHELMKGPDTISGWLVVMTPGQQGHQQLWLMGTYTQGDALYQATLN